MPATGPEPRQQPSATAGPSMRALLAACAAAEAVSRPPAALPAGALPTEGALPSGEGSARVA